MTAVPRMLVLMGSGETSPTMVKVHRQSFERLGPPPVRAVLLDTPFGFQENAPEIAERAIQYFRESVGVDVELAGMRRVRDGDALDLETTLDRVARARFVFAGPGSPTYALREWAGTRVPELLADKLRDGGCVTFASAAALTLGILTVPVYEVYKVGADPVWLEGLDLLAIAGVQAAVIPHYNNAEGGHHDTRYCYLGERRLRILEEQLPADAFVLGVDEHTGLVMDLDAGTAEVVGLGVVTLRRRGCSTELVAGTTLAIGDLAAMAGKGGGAVAASPGLADEAGSAGAGSAGAGPRTMASSASSPLLDTVSRLESEFDAALGAGKADDATRAVLALENEIHAWAADTLQSDEMERARATLRSMVVRLGKVAEIGAVDPTEVVGGFVEALLEQRAQAREEKRWADADAVRDRLIALGVELRDSPEGTEWGLLS